LFIFLCSLCFIFSCFNTIQYHWFSARKYETNDLEVYWPLALLISTIFVLQIYETAIVYRDIIEDSQPIQKSCVDAKPEISKEKSIGNEDSPNSTGKTTFRKYIGSLYSWGGSLCYFILFFVIAGIHTGIPTIYRYANGMELFIDIPWQVKSIRVSYMVFSGIFYFLLLITMNVSIVHYSNNFKKLKKLTFITKQRYRLSVDVPDNSEEFLSSLQSFTVKSDPYYIFISTMTCAVLIDLSLIITVLAHVFWYRYPANDLLTIWCVVDITILSIFIIAFLRNVVNTNKLIMYNFIQQLKQLKRDMIKNGLHDSTNYLDGVIEHLESTRDENAVKLLGFVIDHNLIIRAMMAIGSSIIPILVYIIKN
jgi:hypothetical protein